jgi:hypothetical protein
MLQLHLEEELKICVQGEPQGSTSKVCRSNEASTFGSIELRVQVLPEVEPAVTMRSKPLPDLRIRDPRCDLFGRPAGHDGYWKAVGDAAQEILNHMILYKWGNKQELGSGGRAKGPELLNKHG